VGCGTIQLDGDALLPPERVDPHPSHLYVRLRHRKPRGLAELEESLLKDAQRLRKLRQMAGKRIPKRPRAASAPPERCGDLTWVEKTSVIGLGERAAKLRVGEDGGEIEEGASHGRNWETATLGAVHLATSVNANIPQ
jgi:hypothetical protein